MTTDERQSARAESRLLYGVHLVALLGEMPFAVAREFVLRYAQVLVRGMKTGKVSIAFGERTLFNTDVMRFFANRDPEVSSVINSGIQGEDVFKLVSKEAFEGHCDKLERHVVSLLG
jgi:hypothetical protein